eukprot:1147232-Pelagomonas_calceolata.AAC.2
MDRSNLRRCISPCPMVLRRQLAQLLLRLQKSEGIYKCFYLQAQAAMNDAQMLAPAVQNRTCVAESVTEQQLRLTESLRGRTGATTCKLKQQASQESKEMHLPLPDGARQLSAQHAAHL